MTPIWIDPNDVVVPENIKRTIDGHHLVAETLVRRGINSPDQIRAFLYPEHYSPSPADEMPGINAAAMRIIQAIDSQETILVWGDFDVDGQTSTTLLVDALRELDAKVTYHIPIRATEGHGILVEVLEQILAENSAIKLLLTCDTGISAHEAVSFANKKGVDVVITDHHELPEVLPPAHAIINPKQLDQKHPLATLPGVGVTYKLVEALFNRSSLTADSHLSPEKYLDLVALGIVADVAEQRGDTRYLLQRGLNKLRNTQRLGLQTLLDVTQIIPVQLDEGHIGFGIAPRLNALGRLSDANPIVEFLTTEDSSYARVFATHLEGLNERRKLLTDQIFQAAINQVDQDASFEKQAVLVLAHPGWHTGVIGIVASKIVERYGKPTILLSIGDDGIAHGSARSIEGIHIADAIASQNELLIKYGGHPGAAGLSLSEDAIPQFKRGLGSVIRAQHGGQPPERVIKIDAYLPLSDISLDLADDIVQLAPFGSGNPPLNLATRNLRLINHSPIGPRKNHLRLVVSDHAENHQKIIWWNGVGNIMPEAEVPFDLVYAVSASTFRGERQLQVEWVDFRSMEEINPDAGLLKRLIDVVDYRSEGDQLAILDTIRSSDNIQIWAEGEAKQMVGGLDRNELVVDIPLAVWTAPAGPFEWQQVLDQVKPTRIYLFAVDPKMDDPKVFLARLAGLIKFILRAKNGESHLKFLAAATCQQENTVRMGLLWMEAKGIVKVLQREEATFWLVPGSGNEGRELAKLGTELKSMLVETAAYRLYFKTTKNNLT